MATDTDKLQYVIAFIDGAMANGGNVVISDPDMARDTRGWLEELRQSREPRRSRGE